eukprot:CAMPEP_0194780826 /NCGR_PEP_ID=MMETSP0323_2-20130528/74585_1 /TAXON_ID=2866 ORGANISM="Crypthecodinium cohnii, Strain Seligo" /NCGR_SAMPLE_ID=MMETSP0323_2 /ASSEMBLY_ACC=CAM_ASM_000346 /LENGTH=83 /DNA_ID=CAMNT_0039718947 /DNA_START=73 /DNA_END=321 /DNA_ORIENTATION=-
MMPPLYKSMHVDALGLPTLNASEVEDDRSNQSRDRFPELLALLAGEHLNMPDMNDPRNVTIAARSSCHFDLSPMHSLALASVT